MIIQLANSLLQILGAKAAVSSCIDYLQQYFENYKQTETVSNNLDCLTQIIYLIL